MHNARLCETVRPTFFLASPRHFDFLNCETKILKCFKYEHAQDFQTLEIEIRV